MQKGVDKTARVRLSTGAFQKTIFDTFMTFYSIKRLAAQSQHCKTECMEDGGHSKTAQWVSQYQVVVGSAVEIIILLFYVQDFQAPRLQSSI